MFFIILYNYLNSLKWVLLIGIILFYLRIEIKSLLNKITVIHHGNTAVEFQGQTKESEENNIKIEEIKKTKTEKDLSEIIEKKDSEINDNKQQIFKLTLEKHFEYTYRLIFRSQIHLLQNLQSFSDGFSQIQIDLHFEKAKSLFEVFNAWTSETYLKFLYDQNLIERDGMTKKIKITNIGDSFIKYLVLSNYNFNDEKNL